MKQTKYVISLILGNLFVSTIFAHGLEKGSIISASSFGVLVLIIAIIVGIVYVKSKK